MLNVELHLPIRPLLTGGIVIAQIQTMSLGHVLGGNIAYIYLVIANTILPGNM